MFAAAVIVFVVLYHFLRSVCVCLSVCLSDFLRSRMVLPEIIRQVVWTKVCGLQQQVSHSYENQILTYLSHYVLYDFERLA